jgi:hypothetical protein
MANSLQIDLTVAQTYITSIQTYLTSIANSIHNAQEVMINKGGKASLIKAATTVSDAQVYVADALSELQAALALPVGPTGPSRAPVAVPNHMDQRVHGHWYSVRIGLH